MAGGTERSTTMIRKSCRSFLILALLVGGASKAAETPRLFELAPGDMPPHRGIDAAWRVTVDEGLVMRGSGQLRLDLPDGLEVVAQRREAVRRGVDSAMWHGRLTDGDVGEVVLSLTDGVLSGYITSQYGEYEVRPLPDGDYMVGKLDADRTQGCDTKIAAAPSEPSTPPHAVPPVAHDGPGSLDILVLFTPEARDAMGGNAFIKSRIQLMVDSANVAFANSQMSARLHLVHSGISGFSETGDGEVDLVALRNNNHVKNLRAQYSADLVALVVDFAEDLCGIGYVLPTLDPWFADYAFSLTRAECTTTLAHEVGHNLGFQHDPPNANPDFPGLKPYGFGHYVANNFRTVMAYADPCGNCEHLLNFSNPRVDHAGLPTGITDHRDNARLGNLTAPVVANYRLSGVVQVDDFESGTISGWALNRGGLGLVEPGLGGSGFALAVPLAGTASRRFLMHRIGEPGDAVIVEFTLNVGEVDLGTNEAEVEILSFLGHGDRHTALRVKQATSGSYWIILYAKGNTGPYREIARTSLRANHDEAIRLEWLRATGPAAADGFIRLVKNGGNRGAIRDLQNDEWQVREVRVGIPSGSAGVPPGGVLLVDDYRASIPIADGP
jgi:peptidyl-Asp metalloendopeptidase